MLQTAENYKEHSPLHGFMGHQAAPRGQFGVTSWFSRGASYFMSISQSNAGLDQMLLTVRAGVSPTLSNTLITFTTRALVPSANGTVVLIISIRLKSLMVTYTFTAAQHQIAYQRCLLNFVSDTEI